MKIMNKFQKKLANRKKDNKGFSLVELIIVIAIMAILVGIVGTQVIPYIDKSRKAKDVQVLSGLCTDAMTAYSSNASTLDPTKKYTITIDKTAALTVTGGTADENDALKASFNELNHVDKTENLSLESKEGKALAQVTIECQNTTPMVKVIATGFDDIESK